MRIILAPMEGVMDHSMRDLLTGRGGIDRCVTEFVRVTEQTLPARVFYRYCPELHNGGQTSVGTPVFIQLLGGKPVHIAANAVRAERLGAPGIDLNFGCPAKTVNRNDGGSVLLREPQRVAAVVNAVRDAVSDATPVTAKIRLGFDDVSLLEDIVCGIAAAGADELCIHARTRQDGYRPPAYWCHIDSVRQLVTIPIVVNGEIWSVRDALRAQRDSGCQDLMLGRGSLACPDLAGLIKMRSQGQNLAPPNWLQVIELLQTFFATTERLYPRYVGNRIKQWLGYLRRQYQGAELLFQEVKRLQEPQAIKAVIAQHKYANHRAILHTQR
ncbi:MAG: tRNA dihydrouridine synthase [Pseudomonadales bacterium]